MFVSPSLNQYFEPYLTSKLNPHPNTSLDQNYKPNPNGNLTPSPHFVPHSNHKPNTIQKHKSNSDINAKSHTNTNPVITLRQIVQLKIKINSNPTPISNPNHSNQPNPRINLILSLDSTQTLIIMESFTHCPKDDSKLTPDVNPKNNPTSSYTVVQKETLHQNLSPTPKLYVNLIYTLTETRT